MKKIKKIILIMFIVLGLIACSGSKDNISKKEKKTEEKTEYEIKKGDPEKLLKDAGYSVVFIDSYNPSVVIYTIETGVAVTDKKTNDSYVDVIRSTGMTTQTFYNFMKAFASITDSIQLLIKL